VLHFVVVAARFVRRAASEEGPGWREAQPKAQNWLLENAARAGRIAAWPPPATGRDDREEQE
jgi:hypothetical protein